MKRGKIFGMRWLVYIFLVEVVVAVSKNDTEADGEESRKILGSSVVTSVSVVMDSGNGKKTVYTDAIGKPHSKPANPSELASPIELLHPDRYEFYTFDDNGDLVKRLMSLDEIKSIIATGDSDAFDLDAFTSQGFVPEKRVTDVVNNVQNVLKEEMEILRDPISKPIFDTPDVSDSWSMILPAVFGNSGEDIKPEKPLTHVTPDTIMVEPNGETLTTLGLQSSSTTRPTQSSSISTQSTTFISKPVYYSSQSVLGQKLPTSTEAMLNVEIFSNSEQSTEKPSITTAHLMQSDITPTREAVEVTNTLPSLIRTTPSTFTSNITNQFNNNSEPAMYKTTIEMLSSTQSPSNPLADDLKTQSTNQISSTRPQSESTFRPTPIPNSSTSHMLASTTNSKFKTSSITPTTFRPTRPLAIFSSTKFAGTFNQAGSQKATPTTTMKPVVTQKTTKKPITSMPTHSSQDSSTISLLPSSTISIASKTPSLMTSTVSKLTVKPQLNTSTTISNVVQSTSPSTAFKSQSTTASRPSTLAIIITKATQRPNNSSTLPGISNQAPPNTSTPIYSTEKSTTTSKLVSSSIIPADLKSEATTLKDSTTSALNKFESTEFINESSTSSTSNKNVVSTTKIPSLLQSLSNDQKLSASELLDQLLLTTNIYEINTELTSPKVENIDKYLEIGIGDNNSTEEVTDNNVLETTTLHDSLVYPPTTDATIIQSIEQILSQAVDSFEEPINQPLQEEKVQQIIENSAQKNMEENIHNTATVGSILIGEKGTESEADITSTTENTFTAETETLSNEKLSESVGALLSQIYSPTVTTILATDRPNEEITSRQIESISSSTTPVSISTQKIHSSSEKTAQNLSSSTQSNENETSEESAIYYIKTKVPSTTTTTTTTTERQLPHLINITIISYDSTKNRSKPAKADLSLEEKLIAEEMKNMSLYFNHTLHVASNNTESTKEFEAQVTFVNTTPSIDEPSTTTEFDVESTTAFEEILVPFSSTIKRQENDTVSSTESSKSPITTTQRVSLTRKPIKPSIVITINENSTFVTDNGKVVANKTISSSTSGATISTSPVVTPPQNHTWTLVSTVKPHHENNQNLPSSTITYADAIDPPAPIDLVPKPMQGFGLDESTANLDNDVFQFVQLCNELAFGFWRTVTSGLSSARSVFVSPFAATSMLAMVFLGAKGATSEEMNEILKLDDMVTFNPHLIFKNVSESLISTDGYSGVATATIIRELFSDKSKGRLLDFYKNRVKAFYDGYVEEVSYKEIGDVIRRRTNLLVKKETNGKYPEYLRDSSITVRPPLSGVSVNIFETDCSQSSYEGRDGELHFVVLPSIRQRRLIPIPAVVYRSGFLAGYEPSLDATAVSLGNTEQTISTIFVIPGQQGISAPGDGLSRLEKRLVESSFKKGAWSRLLRSLIPRPGLEVQIPRFSHKSIINATSTLKKMGLHELFHPEQADLRGLNGIPNELHLADILQINNFATCGERKIGESHHSEIYPATSLKARRARYLQNVPTDLEEQEPRDYQRAFHDPFYDPTLLALPLSQRPRQARIPDVPRLRFDRPFLYFIRHNPTGLILHMGRFNPRLLP